MQFSWMERKQARAPASGAPPSPRVFKIQAPPLASFAGGRRPFLVVSDERGCEFGLVDLKLDGDKVAIEAFTWISPVDSDVTDQVRGPLRFRGYRIVGGSVVFRDREGRVEARIDVESPRDTPWLSRREDP